MRKKERNWAAEGEEKARIPSSVASLVSENHFHQELYTAFSGLSMRKITVSNQIFSRDNPDPHENPLFELKPRISVSKIFFNLTLLACISR
jgi:hypothetical protein